MTAGINRSRTKRSAVADAAHASDTRHPGGRTDIVPENQRNGDVGHIPPMLLPQDAASRYAQRAARLQTLAAGHIMGDYLQLAASIFHAQQHAALAYPLPTSEA